ncbi:hypothetical protein [Candidimonas nitroreducens]|uniref:Uncharacterized protein n=1 Tax=Candidimonas nitroreducens TaxID=683354 RepID=A0A225M8G8_9BURK|nr:hypothetical protein [Candidimonas nitroreducens]OWT55249.1 hypothetical protein CEY11_21300 [Candidimonas nitroreducens]
MKASTLLRKAKKYLGNGKGLGLKTRYICYAVSNAARDMGLCAYSSGCPAQRRIARRIFRHLGTNTSSYEGWLRKHHPRLCNQLDTPVGRINAQDARRRWMDALIAEFEAEGD